MHSMPTKLLVLMAILATPMLAQDEASLPKGVEELAKAIDASHLLGENLSELQQFTGVLRLETRGKDQDSIEIELQAKFMAPRSIRYRIEEEGEIIERGRDRIGVWDRVGDKVRPLSGREYGQDREQINRHTRLARQLLRFLDPGALLRSLKELSLVQIEELPLGIRGKMRRFTTVSGQLDSFPLYALEENPDKVALKMLIDPESHQLSAVQLVPLNAEGNALAGGELIMLQDHKETQGRLLPTLLTIFRLFETGVMKPYVTVKVFQIDLDPGLTAQDMLRPKN